MEDESAPLAAEREFFDALVAGSVKALEPILADDFMLIDVMSGSEISKTALLAVIGSGQLKFGKVEAAPPRVRLYAQTAIVTGRTQMAGQFGDTPFATRSRYTHVYVEQDGRWRLVAAQGTQISGE
jgi:ketosteroid isomerase-like protein